MKTGEPKPGPNKIQSVDLNLRVKTLLNRNLLLNPVVIASVVWLSVVSLYAMHLSKILVYSTEDVIVTSLWIWIPIAIVSVLFYAFRGMALPISRSKNDRWQPGLDRIEKRLKSALNDVAEDLAEEDETKEMIEIAKASLRKSGIPLTFLYVKAFQKGIDMMNYAIRKTDGDRETIAKVAIAMEIWEKIESKKVKKQAEDSIKGLQ